MAVYFINQSIRSFVQRKINTLYRPSCAKLDLKTIKSANKTRDIKQ